MFTATSHAKVSVAVPSLLFAVTMTLKEPLVLIVPLITPAVLIVSPVGKPVAVKFSASPSGSLKFPDISKVMASPSVLSWSAIGVSTTGG